MDMLAFETMPELPEVETIRRDLARRIVGKTIQHVEVLHAKSVGGRPDLFIKKLFRKKIVGIARRGKLMALELHDGNFVLVHLKMTGQLIYDDGKRVTTGGHPLPIDELPNTWTRVVITFSDKTRLFFNDLRLFGYLKIVDEAEKDRVFSEFGIEPGHASWDCDEFVKIVRRSSAPVKAILLDQKRIAGLGNIYVDEACFRAKVRPQRRGNSLRIVEAQALCKFSDRVIAESLKYRGTTFRHFRDSRGKKGNFSDKLRVYGRAGKRCVTCRSSEIEKIKLAGRGTHYCPNCQQ